MLMGRRFATCLLLLVVSVACTPAPAPTPSPGPPIEADVLVIGHRGAAGLAPENTLVAIRTAIELGADAVEFDVRRTSDGELILMHDADVSRTTDGAGDVADLTLDEIRALDAGSWYGEDFAGERVPTLREVFEATADSGIGLFIEVKDPDEYPNIASDLAELIEEQGVAERSWVISFDHEFLQRMRELAPGVRLAAVWGDRLPSSDEAAEFDAVDARYTLYIGNPGAVNSFREAGLQVVAWTVDDEPTMRRLIELGVNGITTNRPDVLLAILAR